ncbi:hypothetical protein [Macrococcus epidermidis]|nr:hypothetical protein [Macrococcus epidermidis]
MQIVSFVFENLEQFYIIGQASWYVYNKLKKNNKDKNDKDNNDKDK